MRLAVSTLLSLFPLLYMSSGLIAAGAENDQLIVSTQGLTAFDSETLEPRWRTLAGETVHRPVIAAGVAIVSSSSGVYAIESESGAIHWRLDDKTDVFSAVVNGDEAYLASEGGGLYAVDVDAGHLHWQKEFNGWVYPPAVWQHQLYTGGSAGKLWALEKTTGNLLWERDLGQEMVYSPVVTQGGVIIVTTFAKEVLAFSSTGTQLWKTQLPAVVSSPVLLNGLLIFTGLDQRLHAMDNRTGERRWSRPLHARLRTPMTVSQNQLIAILDDGRLVSVDSHSGSLEELARFRGEPIAPPFLRGDRIILFLRSFGESEIISFNRQTGKQSVKEI